MKIYIYHTNHSEELVADLIQRLDDAGVPFFIDPNKPSREWYKSNLQPNCRVFNDKWDYYDSDYPNFFIPFVLCSVEAGESPDWVLVQKQLCNFLIKLRWRNTF